MKCFPLRIAGNTSRKSDKIEVLEHFTMLSKSRSGNAAVNKDRKNLKAAWRWGQSYLEGFPGMNSFQIERITEKRHPRDIPTIDIKTILRHRR
jgi:hypothetical protein